jgi:2-phospho-L-lactate/phosphoenolpyruvate guanylyltransferase
VTSLWRAVIPLRLSDAKSRLSSQTAARRRDLVVAMACDVIAATESCPVIDDVVLVADAEGLDAVRGAGLHGLTLVRDPGTGLNAAILAGAHESDGDSMAGPTGRPVAVLLADVPCATPEALEQALAACKDGRVIVSDAEGIGTTLLAARDARRLDPRFGPRSRAAHIASGAREVMDSAPGALAGLRRDVDSEVDLWDAERLGIGAYTRAALDRT